MHLYQQYFLQACICIYLYRRKELECQFEDARKLIYQYEAMQEKREQYSLLMQQQHSHLSESDGDDDQSSSTAGVVANQSVLPACPLSQSLSHRLDSLLEEITNNHSSSSAKSFINLPNRIAGNRKMPMYDDLADNLQKIMRETKKMIKDLRDYIQLPMSQFSIANLESSELLRNQLLNGKCKEIANALQCILNVQEAVNAQLNQNDNRSNMSDDDDGMAMIDEETQLVEKVFQLQSNYNRQIRIYNQALVNIESLYQRILFQYCSENTNALIGN